MLLAAGESRRFPGSLPKQLLLIEGRPLVRRIALQALGSRLAELVVVVGHRASQMRAALDGLPIVLVDNPAFARGQSGSVRAGLAAIDPAARAALFLVADQPRLEAALIDRLISAWEETGGAIVVPTARGRRGSPVLFDAALFSELERISGDTGGRQLFARHRSDIVEVELDDPALLDDVDTPEDLERLAPRG